MQRPYPQVQKLLQEAAAVYSRQHPSKPEGQILHAYLEGNSRGHRWLVQQLESIIPKVADPVLRGLLLLQRCQMQPLISQEVAQWQSERVQLLHASVAAQADPVM
jgi:hypothetical protein